MASRPNRVELFSLSATGGEAYQRLSTALRDAGRRDLRLNMNKAIRRAGRPVVRHVQDAYRGMPNVSAAHREGPQARATVAKAVRMELRTTGRSAGVRIMVDRNRLPQDMKGLPFAWEKGRWRHPVFARSDQTRGQWRWVTQQTRPPFRAAVRDHEHEFRTAIMGAMEDTANALRLGR